MIFYYTYITHKVESLNTWIEHLVLEVWCKAKGPFDAAKLHPDFKVLVYEANPKFLLHPILEIYDIIETLPDIHKQWLADGYKTNNDLEKICTGQADPITYSDIAVISVPLAKAMADFFPALYTDVLGLAAYTNKCGILKEYYDAFMQANHKGKCPFCGLNDLKSELLSKREAYDHYLPKAIYPFNSVNFRNLLPTCNTCNSSYKGTKEMIFDKSKKRRKAFYPYSLEKPDLNFGVQVAEFNMQNPKDSQVEIRVDSTSHTEEVAGWMEVYGLGERYADKCRSEDSLYWIEQIFEEVKNHTDDFEEWFLKKIEQCNRRPHLEYNFLRAPFLQSCKQKKYFVDAAANQFIS